MIQKTLTIYLNVCESRSVGIVKSVSPCILDMSRLAPGLTLCINAQLLVADHERRSAPYLPGHGKGTWYYCYYAILCLCSPHIIKCWTMSVAWLLGFKMAVEMWSETEDLDAIIGAACSVVCQPVAVLAAYWNIPSVSYAATSGLLSDKSMYPTFTRTVGTWIANVPTMSAFLDVFG